MDLAQQSTIRPKKTVAEVIASQRWELMNESPFFAVLAMHLTPTEAPWCLSNGMPTMGTEGKHLFYHPNIQDAFSKEEIKVIILHEILHAAFAHMSRKGNRDDNLWNIACDYAVNSVIHEMVYVLRGNEERYTLPKLALHDDKYKGMSAEKIYVELSKDIKSLKNKIANFPGNQSGKGGAGKGSQGSGDSDKQKDKDKKKQRLIDIHIDPSQGIPSQGAGQGNGEVKSSGKPDGPPVLSKEEVESLEKDWAMRIMEASIVYEGHLKAHGRGRGNMPGQLRELVEQIKRPKTTVYNMISRFMHMAVTDHVNWNQPHTKRIAATGFYMPTKKNLVMDPLIVVDTSGSISKDDLSAIFGVIDKIIKALPVNNVRYMECDTDIQKDIIIRKADRSKGVYGMFPDPEIKGKGSISVQGRGGTDFRAPFERILKDRDKFNPSFILYITADGNGTMPEKKKFPINTLWLVDEDQCTDTKSFPFGKVATYDRKFIEDYGTAKDNAPSSAPSQ